MSSDSTFPYNTIVLQYHSRKYGALAPKRSRRLVLRVWREISRSRDRIFYTEISRDRVAPVRGLLISLCSRVLLSIPNEIRASTRVASAESNNGRSSGRISWSSRVRLTRLFGTRSPKSVLSVSSDGGADVSIDLGIHAFSIRGVGGGDLLYSIFGQSIFENWMCMYFVIFRSFGIGNIKEHRTSVEESSKNHWG